MWPGQHRIGSSPTDFDLLTFSQSLDRCEFHQCRAMFRRSAICNAVLVIFLVAFVRFGLENTQGRCSTAAMPMASGPTWRLSCPCFRALISSSSLTIGRPCNPPCLPLVNHLAPPLHRNRQDCPAKTIYNLRGRHPISLMLSRNAFNPHMQDRGCHP